MIEKCIKSLLIHYCFIKKGKRGNVCVYKNNIILEMEEPITNDEQFYDNLFF